MLLEDNGESLLVCAYYNLALEELKDRCGNLGGYGTEERLLEDLCLALAESDKKNLLPLVCVVLMTSPREFTTLATPVDKGMDI